MGRVLARYYNWYGIMGRLRAYLKQLGWTEERITQYDRANRLTVSQEHERENPKVPAPSDMAWLRAHMPLPGRAKPPRKRGAVQTGAPKAWYCGPPQNLPIPEVYRTINKEAPFPEAGARDCPGHEGETELCQWGNPGTAGGSGGIPRRFVRGH